MILQVHLPYITWKIFNWLSVTLQQRLTWMWLLLIPLWFPLDARPVVRRRRRVCKRPARDLLSQPRPRPCNGRRGAAPRETRGSRSNCRGVPTRTKINRSSSSWVSNGRLLLSPLRRAIDEDEGSATQNIEYSTKYPRSKENAERLINLPGPRGAKTPATRPGLVDEFRIFPRLFASMPGIHPHSFQGQAADQRCAAHVTCVGQSLGRWEPY